MNEETCGESLNEDERQIPMAPSRKKDNFPVLRTASLTVDMKYEIYFSAVTSPGKWIGLVKGGASDCKMAWPPKPDYI